MDNKLSNNTQVDDGDSYVNVVHDEISSNLTTGTLGYGSDAQDLIVR